MLERLNQVVALYDVYQAMLTDKQREYLELYYQENLTLSEIATELGVSRNAVHDNIKRTEALLFDYEKKLAIFAREQGRQEIYEQLRDSTNDECVLALIQKLEDY